MYLLFIGFKKNMYNKEIFSGNINQEMFVILKIYLWHSVVIKKKTATLPTEETLFADIKLSIYCRICCVTINPQQHIFRKEAINNTITVYMYCE